MQETRDIRVQSLGWEEPMEQEMATHFNIFAWKIPWAEKPNRLHFVGSQRDRTEYTHTHRKEFRFRELCSQEAGSTFLFRNF